MHEVVQLHHRVRPARPCLPVGATVSVRAVPTPADPRRRPATRRRPRVLLVDDHDDIRMLWRVLLESSGAYDIAEASDGAVAIADAAQHPPDVVVTDLAMPVASGYEVIRAMRASHPGTAVVACSATNAEREALAEGACAFLAKERSVTDLAPTVDACLAGWSDERRQRRSTGSSTQSTR